ncbi:hypothetical protein HY213_04465 [Candidatus Peregrinibacteria bacterium]|nr:hypothetical protein [Candidatus Peregrinibacteria bacterium]
MSAKPFEYPKEWRLEEALLKARTIHGYKNVRLEEEEGSPARIIIEETQESVRGLDDEGFHLQSDQLDSLDTSAD